MSLLKSTPARILTLVLLVHAALFYGFSREEAPPPHRTLSEFPQAIGDWTMYREGVVEDAVQEVLQASDTLVRFYTDGSSGNIVSLFIAYFQTQRTGVNPHSPKHCLPGAGWAPTETEIMPITVPGRSEAIKVNRYIIAKGEEKSVVLYWYQGRGRVIASEYFARAYLIADSIRYNRSDTSLVRIIVPVTNGDEDAATDAAIDFAQASFPHFTEFLPD